MLSSFAKGPQTIAKTLLICSSENVRYATARINSSINVVQLSSYRFFFKSSLKNYDYQTTKFVNSHNNHYRSILKMNTSRPLPTIDHFLNGENFPAIIESEKSELQSVFPDIVRELSEMAAQIDPKYTPKWFAKSVEYNAGQGKLFRGLITVLAFKTLAKPEMITPENIRLAQYLGWCTEMVNASLVMLDDVMDYSETRRGVPCWYKLDDVKSTAVNDAIMIEHGIYMLLKHHFSDTSYYADIYDLFHDAIFTSCCSELVDLQNVGVDEFTMERYLTIIQNKTTWYTFYLPMALAMYLAGYTDSGMFRQTKEIAIKLGEFFQIQNDIMDCFGNPNLTGKIGNDIENGAATWLSALCMQRANEQQKNIMRENYGKTDPEKVASIKKLYEELALLDAFLSYKQELYNTIKNAKTTKDTPDTFIKLKRVIFNTFICTNMKTS